MVNGIAKDVLSRHAAWMLTAALLTITGIVWAVRQEGRIDATAHEVERLGRHIEEIDQNGTRQLGVYEAQQRWADQRAIQDERRADAAEAAIRALEGRLSIIQERQDRVMDVINHRQPQSTEVGPAPR
jgi:hypothetical protein